MAEPDKWGLSGTTGTGDILCPFFCAHGKRAIKCVDIYPGSRNVTTDFEDEDEKRFQMETYCKKEYRKCWLYDMAMRMQWDDRED